MLELLFHVLFRLWSLHTRVICADVHDSGCIGIRKVSSAASYRGTLDVCCLFVPAVSH